ncbi:uncharacterized protein LOC131858602 [Cryptomeria japonica]|uniref:uncharacterized protein LOC131858602 n=1 Tax=Cryptomeria japonica TaxID=3369 RepID=UPI0027DA76DF|nr:uncharacterized protein LOC131858602 [Cryptomeria japonica]
MVPSLRIAIKNRLGDMESLRERLYVLNKLDEKRMMTQWATEAAQQRRKLWHDKHLKRMRFVPRQLVLKYNGRNEIKLGKFKVRWLGPYRVQEVAVNGAMKLWTLNGREVAGSINGSKLKLYHEQRRSTNPESSRRNT